MKRPKTRSVAVGASTLILVAACGGSDGGEGSAGDSAEGSSTINVWINGTDQDQGELMSELVPEFEEANPDISVNVTIVDWATANQQILTAAAGGALPDVMTLYSVDVPGFAEQDLLLPLDDYIDSEQYLDTGVDLGSWGDAFYAAPWTMKVRSLAVRTDFAEEAGLDPNALPETWEETRTWANALVARDGNQVSRVGFWVVTDHPYKTIQQFIPMLWSNGGRMFSADGCAATFHEQPGIEAVEFLSGLLNEDKVDFAGSVEADNTDFGQGKAAMLISNIPVRGWARDFPELEEDVAAFNPTPHTEGNASYSEMGGNFLTVAKDSDSPEAAAKFVEYMTTDENALVEANTLDLDVVPLKDAADWEYTQGNAYVQRFSEIMEETGAGAPKHPEWPEIQNTVTAALSEIYLNGADAETTLTQAAEAVDAILQQSGCAEEAPNS